MTIEKLINGIHKLPKKEDLELELKYLIDIRNKERANLDVKYKDK